MVIIGGGFGGLATALCLAQLEVEVELFEAQPHLGGCASTFQRRGLAFEAGATLLSGLGPGQLLARWIEDQELAVEVTLSDPVVEFRTPVQQLVVPSSREAWIDQICRLPGAPAAAIRRFYRLQRGVADALWAVLDHPEVIRPSRPGDLRWAWPMVRRGPLITSLMGQPLGQLLRRLELDTFVPLRWAIDSACQITVQTSSSEAEAPLALAALDYFFRGAGHVEGGMGALAEAMGGRIERLGGRVHRNEKVLQVVADGAGFVVESDQRRTTAQVVAANLLPGDLTALLGVAKGELPSLDAMDSLLVDQGWGAAMLYLSLDEGRLPSDLPHHLDLTVRPDLPLTAGNHLFLSLGTLGSDGWRRGATASTHVPMDELTSLPASQRRAYLHGIHSRMVEGIERLAPEVAGALVDHFTAGPDTFERFTGRSFGVVGGAPRVAGLHNYRRLGPCQPMPGLFLVGDTVFPGQSVLAVAAGGAVAARAIRRRLKRDGVDQRQAEATSRASST